jgi:hypothetical protein
MEELARNQLPFLESSYPLERLEGDTHFVDVAGAGQPGTRYDLQWQKGGLRLLEDKLSTWCKVPGTVGREFQVIS